MVVIGGQNHHGFWFAGWKEKGEQEKGFWAGFDYLTGFYL